MSAWPFPSIFLPRLFRLEILRPLCSQPEPGFFKHVVVCDPFILPPQPACIISCKLDQWEVFGAQDSGTTPDSSKDSVPKPLFQFIDN